MFYIRTYVMKIYNIKIERDYLILLRMRFIVYEFPNPLYLINK